MAHPEALGAIAIFGLHADDFKHRIDQLSTFGVTTLRPIVSGSSLSEDKVVRVEGLAEQTGTKRSSSARPQVL